MACCEHVPAWQAKCDKKGSHLTHQLEILRGTSKRVAGSPDANANMSRHKLGRYSFESPPSLLDLARWIPTILLLPLID
jgi:hypothetical protein